MQPLSSPLCHSLLLVTLCGCGIFALVQRFDPFDRKVFKTKKQRYATFDKHGILTLDGSLNGKSNDITFPNTEKSELNQFMCNTEPKLLFEFCETAKYMPWTGLAICYESQLQQPYLNPSVRIQPTKKKAELTKVICGERQSAIYINREVPKMEERGGKYRPSYSISTSFTDEKLIFEMPNGKSERKCTLLELGGNSLLDVKMRSLRREKVQMTKSLDDADGQMEVVGKNSTAFFKRWEKFTDWANRRFQRNESHSISYLMLDFLPPYGFVQNISVYGWLPFKIKITGQSIKPCTLDWQLLKSRTVSGGLTANKLEIVYTLQIGEIAMLQKTNATGNETIKEESKTDTTSFGAQAGTPQMGGGGGMKGGRGIGGIRGGGRGAMMGAFAMGGNTPPSLTASVQTSFSNTHGFRNSNGQFESITDQLQTERAQTRTETVTFFDFAGTINVEQLVYQCHGVEIRPDKIRYHDPEGNAIMPNAVKTSDETDTNENLLNDGQTAMDDCMDNVVECAIWARQGECQSKAAFMLTRCKQSCGLCTLVVVKNKEDRRANNADGTQDEPEECGDLTPACAIFSDKGLCQRNPLVMSNYCRLSCGLCVSDEDAFNRYKEIEAQEMD